MGARGPTPTPSNILKARGSRWADVNRSEVQPERITPARPEHLDQLALAAWDFLVPMLERLGLLTEADGVALERYCFLYSQWRKTVHALNQMESLSYDKIGMSGNVTERKEVPEIKTALSLSKELTRLESLFGLNPSARSRISVGENGKQLIDGKGNPDPKGLEQLRRLGLST